jgi:hypothetical protein
MRDGNQTARAEVQVKCDPGIGTNWCGTNTFRDNDEASGCQTMGGPIILDHFEPWKTVGYHEYVGDDRTFATSRNGTMYVTLSIVWASIFRSSIGSTISQSFETISIVASDLPAVRKSTYSTQAVFDSRRCTAQ